MKKFTKSLLIAGLSLVSGVSAFAQTPKSCDLGVTLVTPAANAVFNIGDDCILKFDIKNNGPAAIAPTDTIYYQMSASENILSITGKTVASGGTTTIDLGKIATWKNDGAEDISANFCVKLLAQNIIFRMNGTDTVWAKVTYTDAVAGNDQSCNPIKVKKKAGTGIFDLGNGAKEALSLYPNPASSRVTFSINLEKSENVQAVVRDLTGREVLRKDFGKVQAGNTSPFALDIAALNAGIYMVEVNAGDRRAIGKVTKQN
ncbi:T9SS type A sorting domain-containing protein [Taibaiella chishuiensis]|uniref:Putative secreted protein (Por secretion system target) n=1 Tax=Taibaiella chishuiensis TaxID=1434707 RepID=A0A2P8DBG3_9BACT|nr:T9SS type A sorting domain-containing protein [Taibaiella chishuiensis]PSK94568.1 putative secreted protein (Por secretion system target) [Taibaiella chishuiensis]